MADEVTQEVAETPPTVEDLQRQVQEVTERADRAEGAYKDVQRKESKLADREHKLTSVEEMQRQLQEERAEAQEDRAAMLDYLDENRGEPIEQKPQSRVDRLREERAKVKPKQTAELSSEDQELMNEASWIMRQQGWDTSSPAYKKSEKAVSFKDLVEVLRAEQTAENEGKVEEKANLLHQQKLKKEGSAASEGTGPSAGGLDDDEFLLAYSEGKSDDHARAKKLTGT